MHSTTRATVTSFAIALIAATLLACADDVGDGPDAGLTAVADGAVGVGDIDGDIGEPPTPFEAQFVWPAPAWIAANDRYADGKTHSGSADLALPYWTPVGAARGGTVTAAQNSSIGGYLVYIDHAGGYRTLYSHLSEKPLVAVGERVETGQLIGFSGRTGNAFRNGAHLHFAIFKDDVRVTIPGIELGQWVHRGQPIPGRYGSISQLTAPGPTMFRVDVVQQAPVFERPSQRSARLGTQAVQDSLEVTSTRDGYYQVPLPDGGYGWIVHTVTVPTRSNLRAMRVVANSANVRSGPSTSNGVIGTLANGSLVTTFEKRGDWYRLLYGLPTVYAWTHSSNIESTPIFETRIRTQGANVRAAPEIGASVVGRLNLVDVIRVLEVREGWYRLRFAGQTAWVAGWLTQGPL